MKRYRTEFGDEVDVCAGVLALLAAAGLAACAVCRVIGLLFLTGLQD